MLPIMFSGAELALTLTVLRMYQGSTATRSSKDNAEDLFVRLTEIREACEEQTEASVEPGKKVIGACAVQVERNTKVLEMLLEKLSFFDIGFARDEMKDILTGDSVSDTEKEEG